MIYYKDYMVTVLNKENKDLLRTKMFTQFDLNVVRELITESLQNKDSLTFICEQTATLLHCQNLVVFGLNYDDNDELKLSLKTYKRRHDENYEKFYSENFTSLLEWKRELERFLAMNIIETER